MKKVLLVTLLLTFGLTLGFMQYLLDELDPGYINKFGNGSICVSDKGYPAFDKFDESQFDFRDGKFYISTSGTSRLDMRAMLPEGKTYRMLITDFLSRKPYKDEAYAEKKIFWRIFVSHNQKGEKIYPSFPPSASEMLQEVTYMTSEKELAFIQLNARFNEDLVDWKTSGLEYGKDLVVPIGMWLQNAKPGYQMYIVHTVGYIERHTGNDRYIVDDPIITALVEVK